MSEDRILTTRQEKFCVLLVYPTKSGKLRTAGEAYKEAGFECKSETVATVNASRLKKTNPAIRKRIAELRAELRAEYLDKKLAFPKLVDKITQGLDAKLVKTATYEGKIDDERYYVDFPTRRAYVELALKLRGDLEAGPGDLNDAAEALGSLISSIARGVASRPILRGDTANGDPQSFGDEED